MKFFSILLILLFSSQEVLARPVMAVLEFHAKDSDREKTRRFADRLREEFYRRYGKAILTKPETEDLFHYHKEGVLKKAGEVRLTLLERAKQAYFELKLTEAEKLLGQLIERRDEDSIVDGHLLLGLTKMAQENRQGARAAFQEARRMDPKRKLDPQFFPPKAIKLFNKVAAESHPPTGTIAIDAKPEGAEVWINGVLKGLAPLTLSRFPAGFHRVRIRANHYQPVVRAIDLKADGAKSIRVSLPWESSGSRLGFLGMTEAEIGGEERLPMIGSDLGSEIGVSKVLFVTYRRSGGGAVETALIDVGLRTSHKKDTLAAKGIEKKSAELAGEMTDRIGRQIGDDIEVDPAKYGENRYQGDIVLIGHHRKPFYKKTVIWVGVGAVAAAGVIAGVLLTGGASTGGLGLVFQ